MLTASIGLLVSYRRGKYTEILVPMTNDQYYSLLMYFTVFIALHFKTRITRKAKTQPEMSLLQTVPIREEHDMQNVSLQRQHLQNLKPIRYLQPKGGTLCKT